jgi:transposase
MALDAGIAKAQVARVFSISVRTINRYRQRDVLAATPVPGRPPSISAAQAMAQTAQSLSQPDATLRQHWTEWKAAQRQRVSHATMSRVIIRLGWTRKSP